MIHFQHDQNAYEILLHQLCHHMLNLIYLKLRPLMPVSNKIFLPSSLIKITLQYPIIPNSVLKFLHYNNKFIYDKLCPLIINKYRKTTKVSSQMFFEVYLLFPLDCSWGLRSNIIDYSRYAFYFISYTITDFF